MNPRSAMLFSRQFHLTLVGLAMGLFTHAAVQGGTAAPDTLNRVDEMGRKQGFWRIEAPKVEKPGYTDGQLIEQGRYANSKRVGVWQSYWPSGKVKSEISYQMGRPKGDYVTYYQDGKVEEKGTWDLDRNTGKFQRYHPNGKLAQDFVFNPYGVRDGVQRYYHENGQLEVEVTVKEGQEEGTLKRYYANGETQQVAQFAGGDINEATSKYVKPVHKETAVVADPVGKAAPAPTAEESTNSNVFRENGYNTLYDKQLRLSKVGDFRAGRLWNGKVYKYDKDGKLVRIEMFLEGHFAGNGVITDEDK
ncbi:MAG: toxin-antitoxin system YwqK family antitoxin [Flavobacteriales bacterium]|nr:toxin-antitoxin system YwqK family antitoxin [Flavobacteriales bacterium]